MSFTRVHRVGVLFGFVRFSLLLAVVLCWVTHFGSCVLLGLFCLLRVIQVYSCMTSACVFPVMSGSCGQVCGLCVVPVEVATTSSLLYPWSERNWKLRPGCVRFIRDAINVRIGLDVVVPGFVVLLP